MGAAAPAEAVEADLDGLQAGCTRFLSMHRRVAPREALEGIAASPYAELPWDTYGEGALVRLLEERVAALLGKEAAVFVSKGVTAQQAALRVWADRARLPTVALHPRSHVDADERGAYEALHRLRAVRVGTSHAPFTADELESAHEPVGVVTVELPLRRAGYLLPSWEELSAVAAWAREHGAALHLDGARLWGCEPFYGRPFSEIAALADSVYVSLYKDLGGLGGCVLAGTASFVAEARVWVDRHAGPMFSAYPYLVSALDGLDRHLPRMGEHVARARELAAALDGVGGLRTLPARPHTNGFQLLVPAPPPAVLGAAMAVAAEHRVWIARRVTATDLPEVSTFDVQVGTATGELATGEAVELLSGLAGSARRHAAPEPG